LACSDRKEVVAALVWRFLNDVQDIVQNIYFPDIDRINVASLHGHFWFDGSPHVYL